MKRFYLIITILFVGVSALWSQHANVIWNTPSRNSSESMPCGGGDIGMNIWVEDGDVMFYVSRSGTFDENNCQLKQGRVRLRLSPNPFKDAKDFRQELKLKDGYVEIAAGNTQIQFWVDVFHPIIHVEVTNEQPLQTEVFYENWRYQERPVRKGEGQQCSYKWAPPKGTVTEADFISLGADSKPVRFFVQFDDMTYTASATMNKGRKTTVTVPLSKFQTRERLYDLGFILNEILGGEEVKFVVDNIRFELK
mgnify:CR=1 FL=1